MTDSNYFNNSEDYQIIDDYFYYLDFSSLDGLIKNNIKSEIKIHLEECLVCEIDFTNCAIYNSLLNRLNDVRYELPIIANS